MASPPENLEILYEDNHLLVLNKPALLPTMGVAEGEDSLLLRAKRYLKVRHEKPGNVYLGVVSRLDAPVSGVLVFARTSKAAARLSLAFQSRAANKVYRAVVEGTVQDDQGRWTDWVFRDEPRLRMQVTSPGHPGAREAQLQFVTRLRHRRWTLLDIQLITGRRHQIRVQAAARGHPLAGDRRYGSQLPFAPGIALHAFRLELKHPTRDEVLRFEAPIPTSWSVWGELPGVSMGS